MGWFDEQIRERKNHDDDVFSDSVRELRGAVVGENISLALNDASIVTQNAIDEILKYYHVKARDKYENVTDMNERLDYMLRPFGIMRRSVKLSEGWYKDAVGAMPGRFKTGESVALIPSGMSGYYYNDPQTGVKTSVNRKNEKLFDGEALCFYKPLPLKKIGIPDLMRYIVQTLSISDVVFVIVLMFIVTLIGLIMPKLNNLLIAEVLPSGSTRVLVAMGLFMAGVLISSTLIEAVKSLFMARIDTKLSVSVEAASMMRVLSMPADFFRKYSSGELATRSNYISTLCDMLVSSVLSTGLTSLFSLIYIFQIFGFAASLVVPSLCITLVTIVFSLVSTLVQMKRSKIMMENGSRLNGLCYALISGIQKIKLSGSEKRAFARWADSYSEDARMEFCPPMFIKINSVISTGISLIGTIVLYYAAIKSGVSVANYYSFNASYGMVSGAFASLSGIALTVAQIKPILEMASPLLENVPEQSEGKQVVTGVTGNIELSDVSFRYSESMPLILDNMSLRIKQGQYIAIVGPTGAGKSTLVRILLGFETPQKGAVYYDGKDMETLDPKSLRRRIGVVTQDGKLFQGDIYENIVISAPWLTQKDAWEAAELAGMAEDIHQMPMGMNTMISGGSGGISGGQKQRLMIARAIAPKPKILIFDEATSALDNITQKKVSESLDSLKCTRIVIAHRLSTIRHCDRILYLDGGHILEDGTYEELIAKNGLFADLVARQRLDVS
jgi:NHLM bacteriocin system ABC transporter ATP-binding protein